MLLTPYELQAAVIRYFTGYDSNNMDLVAEAFTEDGEITGHPDPEIHGPDAVTQGFRFAGRQEIVERTRQGRSGFAARREIPRHTLVNFVVEDVNDTEATVRSYTLFYVQSEEGTRFSGISTLVDRLVNDNGTWRIRSHHLLTAPPSTPAAPPAAR